MNKMVFVNIHFVVMLLTCIILMIKHQLKAAFF